jgi:hypothetical protein
MTPLPVAESFDAFNVRLLDACTKRRQAILRGHTVSIAERMQADLAAFIKLPPAPYDACDKVTARVSSLSLVRYKNNDYSVVLPMSAMAATQDNSLRLRLLRCKSSVPIPHLLLVFAGKCSLRLRHINAENYGEVTLQ